ncbi:hypothetical protein [Symbiopectobacterium sp. RP]|uniref:hypothetical protein n=1 Tax=Symbiopectobacterium sp. RP TaxID=3248553 RepID=UPI003D2B7B89
MKKSTLQVSAEPDIAADPLHELIRNGAMQLIAAAVEVELEAMLQQHAERRLDDGPHAVVRNGYSQPT